MTKLERNIILDQYQDIYYVHNIVKIDKSDSIRELSILLDILGMKKERIQRENIIIIERDSIKFMNREMFSMIFDTFAKYNYYTHYDMKEIDMIYDELQFHMTAEEVKCHEARIKYMAA